MYISEYIKSALSDHKYVEELLEEKISLQSDDIDDINKEFSFMIEALQNRMSDSSYEQDFWKILLPYIKEELLSNKAIRYFFENKICLDDIGHKNLSNEWLLKIGEYVDESLFTVGKRIYFNNNHTHNEFMSFINRYIHKESVINHLLTYSEKADFLKKNMLIYKILKHYNPQSEIYIKAQLINQADALSITNDTFAIRKAYERKNYIILLGISKNLFTPLDILYELKDISNIKFAREVRQRSRDTITFIQHLL